jgi:hypothetical protein
MDNFLKSCIITFGNLHKAVDVAILDIQGRDERRFIMMRIHRLFLIAGAIMIAAQLTGCGQNGSTGGGTNATPTNVPSPTVTNTPLPTASTGPVTLRVGATTYHATDTISVTLSNQSTRAIYFPDHLTNCTVILLQHPVNGGWQNINVCKLMTPTGLHKLEAGKSLMVDLTSSSSLWPVGLYRATLRYGTSQSFGGLTTTLYSAGFQVVA